MSTSRSICLEGPLSNHDIKTTYVEIRVKRRWSSPSSVGIHPSRLRALFSIEERGQFSIRKASTPTYATGAVGARRFPRTLPSFAMLRPAVETGRSFTRRIIALPGPATACPFWDSEPTIGSGGFDGAKLRLASHHCKFAELTGGHKPRTTQRPHAMDRPGLSQNRSENAAILRVDIAAFQTKAQNRYAAPTRT